MARVWKAKMDGYEALLRHLALVNRRLKRFFDFKGIQHLLPTPVPLKGKQKIFFQKEDKLIAKLNVLARSFFIHSNPGHQCKDNRSNHELVKLHCPCMENKT
jgi:hypothetical protein